MGVRLELWEWPGEGPGWRPLTDLFAPAAAAALVDAGRARWGGPRDAHGTWAVEDLAWQLGTAAALPLLVAGVTAPLAPDGLRVRVDAAGRIAALACPPGAWGVAGDPVAALRAGLAAGVTPLAEGIAGLGLRTPAHLLRSAGDAIALAFLWAGRATGRDDGAARLAERVLAPPAPYSVPLHAGEPGADPPRRRAGCCLAYRVPRHQRCADCPAGALRRAAALRHRLARAPRA